MGEAKACRNRGWQILGRNLGFWIAIEAGWLGVVVTSARQGAHERATDQLCA